MPMSLEFLDHGNLASTTILILNIDSFQNFLRIFLFVDQSVYSFDVGINWKDMPETVLPTIKELMGTGISIWLYR